MGNTLTKMGIGVLGSLHTSGARLSPRERTALSVLVLRSPEPVGVDELADALWGEHPPPTWAKQVQVCVSRLRSKLPPGTVQTAPRGYRLATDGPEDLDVRAFESGVRRARDLVVVGEPDRAATAFSKALALWRGPAYEDLVDWHGSDAERGRLAELRQLTQEEWLEARLEAGEHRSVIGDASRLVTEVPLREQRWGILALAQYRAGRQGDALTTLRRARSVLLAELGVDPGRELIELERKMLRHDPSLDPPEPAPPVSTVCPYQGLAPYEPADHETYYGRREEVQRCLERLRATGHLVLTGASGSGKTSLLRAGILPALAHRDQTPLYVVPGPDPLHALYSLLATAPPDAPLLVDQLEELFLLGHARDVQVEFCRRLVREAATRTLVLAIRVDQLGELGVVGDLGELVEAALHLVRPLDDEQLREVIEGPATAAGLRLEAGLTDLLLRDAAAGAGSLPLLSHTLVETWEHREGAVLTVSGYRAAGGISAAVARTAERLYDDLSEPDRTACRSVLLHLVELTDDDVPICRPLPCAALRGDAAGERVVAQMVRARLLTLQEDSVEIAHEALVRAWPRLRSWLDDDGEAIRTARHLTLAAAGWQALGRPESELYRGTRLHLALDRSTAHPLDLTPLERDFLAASKARHIADIEAATTAVAAERRSNRRLRLLLGSTASLLVLSLVVGAIALTNRGTALEQRSAAQLEALVGTSLALRSTNRDTAALLAVEAYRRFPDDPRARSALLGTFTADPGFLGYRRIDDATRIDGTLMPDGGTALIVVDGRTAVTMDVVTGRVRPALVDLGDGDIRGAALAVSSDGGRVAVLAGGMLTVDTLDSGQRLLGPLAVSTEAAMALSPDGSFVATSDRTGQVTVRRTADGEEVGVVPATGASDGFARPAIAFTSPGLLAVGSDDGVVRIITLPDLQVVREVSGHRGATDAHVIPVRDGLIVTAGSRRLMGLDPSSGSIRWDVTLREGSLDACRNIAVSEPTERFYCGDPFGVIQERDLSSGSLTGRRFDVQRNDVGDLAIGDAGRELVSFGAFDPIVSRWRLDGSGPVTDLVAAGHVAMDGFEPDGELFVAARRPPDAVDFEEMTEVAVWDVGADRSVVELPAPLQGAGWVAQSTVGGFHAPTEEFRTFEARTGGLLASQAFPETAENVWPTTPRGVQYVTFTTGEVRPVDPETGESSGPSIAVAGPVRWLATSPDGARVAITADRAGTTELTLHDADSGDLLAGPVAGVDTVALSDRAVAGARGGAVTIYDPQTLTAVHALPGARGEVNTLRFSVDGATLMATSNDQTVSVYDTEAWIRLGDPIPADAPFIFPGFLHPSGESLIVTVARGVAWWRLDGETLRAAACEVAGRDFTETEWTAYLRGLGPYRATCTG